MKGREEDAFDWKLLMFTSAAGSRSSTIADEIEVGCTQLDASPLQIELQ
jgi:hypothetical protein